MKKFLLLAVSAALLAGCATSSATKVNKGIISGYSDKITNDARIVGDLKIEIVKTVTLETDRPCSTLDFVKTIISQDRPTRTKFRRTAQSSAVPSWVATT